MDNYDIYFGERQDAVLREHYQEIIEKIQQNPEKLVIKAKGVFFTDIYKRREDPSYLAEEEYQELEDGFSILYPTNRFVKRMKKLIPKTVKELTIPIEFLEDITYLERFPNLEKLTISTSGEVFQEEIEWISANTKIKNIYLRNSTTINKLIGNENATVILGGIGIADYKGIEISCLPTPSRKYNSAITIYSPSFEDMQKVDELYQKVNGDTSDVTNVTFTKGNAYNSPGLQFFYHQEQTLDKLAFKHLTPTEVLEIYKRISQKIKVKSVNFKTKNATFDDIYQLKKINHETDFIIDYGETKNEATLQEYIAMRETIDYYKDLITSFDLSPVEQAAYVYDLLKSFRYQEHPENEFASREIHSIVRDGKIVCVGYASFAEQLLNELGIPSLSVSVTINNPNGTTSGHQRNIIRVDDDKYNIHGMYAMDVTWDSDRDVSVISYEDKQIVVQHPDEELQDKIIDRYDSLSLYRYFLIPMSEYELRFPNEEPLPLYEDYKNGGSKRLVSEARSLRDNKKTIIKQHDNLNKHRKLFSDREGAITVERHFDAPKPSLTTFKQIAHNVRRAQGYTEEETNYDVERVTELHRMINEQNPNGSNLFFRDEKSK